MSFAPDLPRPSPLGDGRFCVHGTAVALGDAAVLLLGPAGSGKSGTAAQLIVNGGGLISDDLVVLTHSGPDTICSRPEAGPCAMELRGFGIVDVPATDSARLALAVSLGAAGPRLPDGETWGVGDQDVPLIRHPATSDLPAKILLWMRAA